MEPKRTRFLSHSLADRTALRPVLLLALLAFSLGLILWLSPAQASTIAASPLASPESLPAAKFTSDARAVINSPLGSQVNQLPFTPLTELPGEVNDFVTALGAVLESQSLSSIAPLPFFAFPLSDPQVGAAPPIITQPIRNTSPQPAALSERHAIYLPFIFAGAQVAPAPAEPPPPPPFSCKNRRQAHWQIQCQALLAFYAATEGNYWNNNAGWRQNDDPCTWQGVTCNQAGNVIALSLSGNGLVGRIPDEIGLLPLESLDVSDNSLVGHLPDALVNLASLRHVDIRKNQLSGSYPLLFVQLSTTARSPSARMNQWMENRFTRIDTTSFVCAASLPISVSECEALVGVFRALYGENAKSYSQGLAAGDSLWVIQPDPCRWVEVTCAEGRVTRLSFQPNGEMRLIGGLTPQLVALTGLTNLTIQRGELTSPLPAEIGFLPKLEWLEITDSRLPGPLPPELGYLAQLKELDLAGNQLVGPVPATLGSLRVITRIDLSRNFLSGPLPDELALINSNTGVKLVTLALKDNPDLCVPITLERFVAGLPLFTLRDHSSCQPRAR